MELSEQDTSDLDVMSVNSNSKDVAQGSTDSSQGESSQVVNKTSRSSKTKKKNPKTVRKERKTFSCKLCLESFPNRSSLTLHSRTHTDEKDKSFRCKYCLKGFSTKHLLEQHEQAHSGCKPYECPKCDKSYKRLDHLRQHYSIHTGVREFICNWPGCGKTFRQQGHLSYHEYSHKQYPYQMGRLYQVRHVSKSKKNCENLKKTPGENFSKKTDLSTSKSANTSQLSPAAAPEDAIPLSMTKNKTTDPTRPFRCPFCANMFTRKHYFKLHLSKYKKFYEQYTSSTTTLQNINSPSLHRPTMDRCIGNRANSNQSKKNVATYVVNNNSHDMMDRLFHGVINSQLNKPFGIAGQVPLKKKTSFSKTSNDLFPTIYLPSKERSTSNNKLVNNTINKCNVQATNISYSIMEINEVTTCQTYSISSSVSNQVNVNKTIIKKSSLNVAKNTTPSKDKDTVNYWYFDDGYQQMETYSHCDLQLPPTNEVPVGSMSSSQVTPCPSSTFLSSLSNQMKMNDSRPSYSNKKITNISTNNKDHHSIKYWFYDNGNSQINSYHRDDLQLPPRHDIPVGNMSSNQVTPCPASFICSSVSNQINMNNNRPNHLNREATSISTPNKDQDVLNNWFFDNGHQQMNTPRHGDLQLSKTHQMPISAMLRNQVTQCPFSSIPSSVSNQINVNNNRPKQLNKEDTNISLTKKEKEIIDSLFDDEYQPIDTYSDGDLQLPPKHDIPVDNMPRNQVTPCPVSFICSSVSNQTNLKKNRPKQLNKEITNISLTKKEKEIIDSLFDDEYQPVDTYSDGDLQLPPKHDIPVDNMPRNQVTPCPISFICSSVSNQIKMNNNRPNHLNKEITNTSTTNKEPDILDSFFGDDGYQQMNTHRHGELQAPLSHNISISNTTINSVSSIKEHKFASSISSNLSESKTLIDETVPTNELSTIDQQELNSILYQIL